MHNEIDFKAVAAQLGHPQGDFGRQVAANMNVSNADMTRHAVDLLDCGVNDTVLEIGPGNGRFAAYVLEKGLGITYTGVEVSETMVDAAREINDAHIQAGRARFEWTDGLHFPVEDGAFDRVFTVNTLYFWPEPAEQLAEIRRVLKPGGTFCLAIASKAFMETLPFTAFGFTLYTPEAAQELLVDHGFRIRDTAIRNHPVVSQDQQEWLREEVFIVAV